MIKKTLFATLLSLSLATPALAEFPKNWYVEGVDAMLDGEVLTTALQADGAVVLSAEMKELQRLDEGTVMDATRLKDGSLLVGTAQQGAVYQIRAGRVQQLLSVPQGMVTAVAQGDDGTLYAAVSGQRKGQSVIYAGQGQLQQQSTVQSGYIWDMHAHGGQLYFVSGSPGALYAYNGREAKLIWQSQESNLRSLHRHPKWGWLIGSGNRGVVYRYNGGKLESLVDTGFDEINAIVSNANGDVFVSANRQKASKNKAKSAVFHISPGRRVEMLFPLTGESSYALSLEKDGTLLVGTGNAGRIYSLSTPLKTETRTLSLTGRSSSDQITHLLPGQNEIFVFGSSPASVASYGQNYRRVGIYESDVLSTGIPALWGTLHTTSVRPAGTRVLAFARSGNTRRPDATWTDWSGPYTNPDEVQLKLPRARYLQLKFELQTSNPKVTPQLHSFEVHFQRDNLPPTLREVFFLQRGVYFKPHTVGKVQGPRTVQLTPRTLNKMRQPKHSDEIYRELAEKRLPEPLRMVQQYDPKMLTLAWDATDANDDEMLFHVAYQPYGESEWKTMARDLNQWVYSFDTSNMNDGQYHFRVYAHDHFSNPGKGFTVFKDSDLITIDNSAPEIRGIALRQLGDEIEIQFSARDKLSSLAYAELAINGQDVDLMPSVDGIVDSKQENFRFRFKSPGPGQHFIVVKVADRLGNVSVGKSSLEVR